MDKYEITDDAWVQVADGAQTVHRMASVQFGEAAFMTDPTDADGYAMAAAHAGWDKVFIPARTTMWAKRRGWKAIVVVGDYSEEEPAPPAPPPLPDDQAIVTDGDTFPVDGGTVSVAVADNEPTFTFTPE